MVNAVWVILIVGGLLAAAAGHRVESLTEAALAAAGKGVEIAFGFVGIMTLWLGMARIAERSGLMRLLARALAPLLRRLFPAVPADHAALGDIAMNLVANMLGMGSAATPFGLKAMQELQRLNPDPATASPDIITFLALNTAALNLVPAAIIALRVASGSRDPTAIVGPTVVATAAAMAVAVTADRILRRLAPPRSGPNPTDGGPPPRRR
ncbi:MAG: nucleoside recognition protein [Actinomycetia bacterium]|nr:nucleoside recognition protein [Actinomycetes bacterium]